MLAYELWTENEHWWFRFVIAWIAVIAAMLIVLYCVRKLRAIKAVLGGCAFGGSIEPVVIKATGDKDADRAKLVDAIKGQLKQLVASGRLTQDLADDIVPEAIASVVALTEEIYRENFEAARPVIRADPLKSMIRMSPELAKASADHEDVMFAVLRPALKHVDIVKLRESIEQKRSEWTFGVARHPSGVCVPWRRFGYQTAEFILGSLGWPGLAAFTKYESCASFNDSVKLANSKNASPFGSKEAAPQGDDAGWQDPPRSETWDEACSRPPAHYGIAKHRSGRWIPYRKSGTTTSWDTADLEGIEIYLGREHEFTEFRPAHSPNEARARADELNGKTPVHMRTSDACRPPETEGVYIAMRSADGVYCVLERTVVGAWKLAVGDGPDMEFHAMPYVNGFHSWMSQASLVAALQQATHLNRGSEESVAVGTYLAKSKATGCWRAVIVSSTGGFSIVDVRGTAVPNQGSASDFFTDFILASEVEIAGARFAFEKAAKLNSGEAVIGAALSRSRPAADVPADGWWLARSKATNLWRIIRVEGLLAQLYLGRSFGWLPNWIDHGTLAEKFDNWQKWKDGRLVAMQAEVDKLNAGQAIPLDGCRRVQIHERPAEMARNESKDPNPLAPHAMVQRSVPSKPDLEMGVRSI